MFKRVHVKQYYKRFSIPFQYGGGGGVEKSFYFVSTCGNACKKKFLNWLNNNTLGLFVCFERLSKILKAIVQIKVTKNKTVKEPKTLFLS